MFRFRASFSGLKTEVEKPSQRHRLLNVLMHPRSGSEFVLPLKYLHTWIAFRGCQFRWTGLWKGETGQNKKHGRRSCYRGRYRWGANSLSIDVSVHVCSRRCRNYIRIFMQCALPTAACMQDDKFSQASDAESQSSEYEESMRSDSCWFSCANWRSIWNRSWSSRFFGFLEFPPKHSKKESKQASLHMIIMIHNDDDSIHTY